MVWEKKNLMTIEDRSGCYDIWSCTVCNYEKKCYGLERDLECPKCGGKGLKLKKDEVKVEKPINAVEPMARIPDTSKRIKYSPRDVDRTNNCTMIVGMCPGRQRKKDQNLEVFHGNRTGDLIEKAIKGLHNIYLTNVFNTYCPGAQMKDLKEVIEEGIQDLTAAIKNLKPKKIICLGSVASKGVQGALKHAEKAFSDLKHPMPEVVTVQHPSYVIRFNKGVEAHVEKIRKEAMSK